VKFKSERVAQLLSEIYVQFYEPQGVYGITVPIQTSSVYSKIFSLVYHIVFLSDFQIIAQFSGQFDSMSALSMT